MYPWIFIAVAAMLIILWLWFYGKRPHKHRQISQNDLQRFLEVLLKRGYDGGFLVVEIPNDPRFMQFSKYLNEEGTPGLRFAFPLAEWSLQYYDSLKETLKARGMQFGLEGTGEQGVSEFLFVDIGNDPGGAVTLATTVLNHVFRLPGDVLLTVYFYGVSPRDEEEAG